MKSTLKFNPAVELENAEGSCLRAWKWTLVCLAYIVETVSHLLPLLPNKPNYSWHLKNRIYKHTYNIIYSPWGLFSLWQPRLLNLGGTGNKTKYNKYAFWFVCLFLITDTVKKRKTKLVKMHRKGSLVCFKITLSNGREKRDSNCHTAIYPSEH